MKKHFYLFATVITLAVISTACADYPDEQDIVYEQLVSYTQYDTKIDFKKYRTFYVTDSIRYVKDNKVQSVETKKDKFSTFNAQLISENMEALGYSMDATNPDLFITQVGFSNQNVIYGYPGWWYNGYWDSYYWYYDYPFYPAYPWYYPYPYPTVIGAYVTGTVAFEMIDTKNTVEKKLPDGSVVEMDPVIWTAQIKSLLLNTNSEADMKNAINECFKQTKAFQ
ncbi:MAG: DUF4136 domain-containing protein [Bacteroidales bacterium]|nr:DUF4136 domain-containing protein [Bacteroidales bacterium]